MTDTTTAMGPDDASGPLLSANNIEVVYNRVILVLKGVSLSVARGGITALLGANGAGKTTTLKAISHILKGERGEVTRGSIVYDGTETGSLTPSDLVRKGLVQVMEGRHCFEHLTVEENLLLGAYTRRESRAERREQLEKTYAYFPRLRDRRHTQAGYISGGEQQMTAIGRALMARPRMILLDEPSMGLAPQLLAEIFGIVDRLNREEKVSFLLAEQNTHAALKHSDYGYILENGRVVMEGASEQLTENSDVKEFYLGLGESGRRGFRDAKHYRRRKRWLS